MSELCVVHLVRRKNGFQPFRRFLDSYLAHAAGVRHDLGFVFKGFRKAADLAPFDAALRDLPHRRLFVPDRGFDIGAYFEAAKAFDCRYLCFVNSFSRILASDWLGKMFQWAPLPKIGVVGATGSYQSVYTDFLDRRATERRRTLTDLLWSGARSMRYLVTIRGSFPAFPNYHVRSNAFLIARDVLSRNVDWPMLWKWDAYRFESGNDSLTSQLLRMGLSPLVVGNDGNAYEKERWYLADTFWIHEQENLLVADNQTEAFANGDQATRARLSYHAWRRWPDGTLRLDAPDDWHRRSR